MFTILELYGIIQVMKTLTKFLILPLFLICIQNVNSIDITGKEVQAYYRGEYTRGNHFLNEISAIGLIELQDVLAFKCGFAIGRSIIDTEINTLINAAYTPFSSIPLVFSVSYIYNGLPEYETHTNSIIPLISFNGKRAGISIGTNFRFTRFFSESTQFEPILSFYGYVNFINNDLLKIGIGAGNITDFQARNMGAFSFNLNAAIQLNDNWLLYNEIELKQSGVDGMATNLYGMAFRTGVKFSW
jgi:hypothetical protein